jgi:GNAT superfamily N-acetyltransferase
MSAVAIERIRRGATADDIRGLARLLLDAIDSNAGISFMPGFTSDQAEAWWRSAIDSASERTVILVARGDDGIVGTVQLQPAWAPNQPHRADVAKLIVHRRAQGRGIARALMQALEHAAAAAGFTLLLLDTCKDSKAERLYTSLGWVRVGEVPDFALNPDGSMCTTVFFYKALPSRPTA